MSTHQRNKVAWDQLAASGSRFAKVATDEECKNPLKTLDTRGWLPKSVAGLQVLCLASGGGWQSILYASAGAQVTVVDISPEMLRLDAREAERRNLQIELLETSMDDLSALAEQSFDIVHQPVSTCYIPDLVAVYREIARVLCVGGLYISQHKQPTSLQISQRNSENKYVIGIPYYHTGPLPQVEDRSYRETGAVEYLHTWEQLVGELCRSGFVLEDFREPPRADPQALPGNFRHRGCYTPPYVRLKARRVATAEAAHAHPQIWTPSET